MFEQAPPHGLGERLLALGRFLRLAPLPPAELSRLARLSRERELHPGDSLLTVGERVRVVHFVVSGRVLLSRDGVDLLTIEPPDTVGLLPLGAGMAAPYQARAIDPVHTVEVSADVLSEMLEDDFEFFLRILRQGAEVVARRRSAPAPPAGVPAAAPPAELDGPLGPAERLLTLRGSSFFQHCPVDGLAAFAKQLEEERLAAAERLVLPSGELALVVSGQATLAPGTPLVSGSVLGAVEGLAEDRRELDLRALTPLRLLRGRVSDLLDTLEDHHAMGRRLLAQLLTMLVQV